MRKYTSEEREFLKSFIPGHSHKEILDEFNKNFPEIRLSQVKSYIKNNKLSTGRTGRFEKGQVPSNKGKKMPKAIYERCMGTMFKEGNIPSNYNPIGTEKLLADGYVWVKVDDKPKAPKRVNWKQKHKLIWEQANGSVPKGYVVIFADQDRSNFNLDNFVLISRAQLVRMNQHGLIKNQAEATRAGVIIADLIIKTADVKKRLKRGSK